MLKIIRKRLIVRPGYCSAEREREKQVFMRERERERERVEMLMFA